MNPVQSFKSYFEVDSRYIADYDTFKSIFSELNFVKISCLLSVLKEIEHSTL